MPNPHPVAFNLASLMDISCASETIPELATRGLQQLIELAVAIRLCAPRYARMEELLGSHNGFQKR
jgi:hypothetical protein